MSTPVVMPQMGESIAEGTIVRWLKKVGDRVDRDEPLFEISTDKVDAEIPSPAAGVLIAITATEGQTVAVNSVVATIGDGTADADALAEGVTQAAASSQPQSDGVPAGVNGTGVTVPPHRHVPPPATLDDVRRRKSSPLVRRIAREHGVDIGQIHGSGIGGRVSKSDILGFLDGKRPIFPSSPRQSPAHVPAYRDGEAVEIKPLSVMRKKIAEHMVLSRRTSAHVHTVFHVNFSTVEKIRHQKKSDYERAGVKLTYMSFITRAVVEALRLHPVVNASLDGDNIVYKRDINIGVAVALESGLIVPVVKNADRHDMMSLSRAIVDLAERARTKQLKPEEVHGGTFTITNPGNFGAQFGMPIINQPQVAILGVGMVEKRAVVIDDAIAIRSMAYLTLGYDHRLVDGALADQFMAEIKHQIEQFDASQV